MKIDEHGAIHCMEVQFLTLLGRESAALIEDTQGRKEFSYIVEIGGVADQSRFAGVKCKAGKMIFRGNSQDIPCKLSDHICVARWILELILLY